MLAVKRSYGDTSMGRSGYKRGFQTQNKEKLTMESTELIKTDTAISPFVIFKTPISDIKDAVVANVGNSGMTASDFERIKIPAGGGTAWTLPGLDGDEIVKELTGIIVAWNDTRVYWSVPMEHSEGNMPPDCYSLDARTGIGKPGGDCLMCPFAQFGSDPRGEGQACKLVRQLFLIREGNILPEIVSLPPSSIRPARQYFMRLAAKAVPCYGLITNIGLEKVKNGQGIVYSRATFTSGGRLTPEQAQGAKAYAAMIEPFLKTAPAVSSAKDVQAAEGEVI
jgi:hypothetical protein